MSSSPDDQIWAKMQFWSHDSILMCQVGVFVNQKDLLGQCKAFLKILGSKVKGQVHHMTKYGWNYSFGYIAGFRCASWQAETVWWIACWGLSGLSGRPLLYVALSHTSLCHTFELIVVLYITGASLWCWLPSFNWQHSHSVWFILFITWIYNLNFAGTSMCFCSGHILWIVTHVSNLILRPNALHFTFK